MDDGLRELVDANVVEIRYPGDGDDLTRDEYSEVKRAAEEIVEFPTQRLETDEN